LEVAGDELRAWPPSRSSDAPDTERPPSGQQDLLTQHAIRFSPNTEARDFRDAFGNVCTRLVAPPGLMEIRNEFLIADSGLPDETDVQAEQWPVGDLPDEALMY
jgi:hypothetical protein